jgi:putative endonuclease
MTKHPFFWIYILECENGTFYTGYTTNLTRRFRQHVDGTANVRYTRSYKPIRIAQCWRLFEPVGCALKIEKMIKSAGRVVKERLVREPAKLKSMATTRLSVAPNLYTFDPISVEKAARALAADEIRNGTDPFASTRPVDL